MTDADMIRQGLREADAGDLTDWDAVKAELLDRAHRNPPPAEWYDSPDEECPFVGDDDEPNAPDLRG